jgi:hypothetical protein
MRRSLLHLARIAFLSLSACGGAEDHPAAPEGGIEVADARPVAICVNPDEGCPCGDAGATAPCTAVRVAGTYKSCEPGVRSCGDDGRWGVCVGPSVWQQSP